MHFPSVPSNDGCRQHGCDPCGICDTDTVWVLWYGGPNYSPGYVEDDTETVQGGTDAVVELMADRAANRDGSTPCVESSEAHVWFADPRGQSDPYPDRIIRQTASGVFRVERV